MGQWFGGARVEMLGVAGVSVAPESRGKGLAKRLMIEMLEHARARGVALSTLYPATLTLYRNVGYELAGTRYRYSAQLTRLPRWRSELDLVVKSSDAAQRLLTFLADHRSTGTRATWYAGPVVSWLFDFPELAFEVTLAHYWMLRVVHVAAALEQRGYPKTLRAELDLEIEDALLAANSGRTVVRLADGRVSVERGTGRGRIRIDIRALAALYTGFATPAALTRSQLLTAGADDLELLGAVFGSGAPGLGDYF